MCPTLNKSFLKFRAIQKLTKDDSDNWVSGIEMKFLIVFFASDFVEETPPVERLKKNSSQTLPT